MGQQYEIRSEHSVEEVFNVIRAGKHSFGKGKAKLGNARIRNFFENGIKCIGCGLEGILFRVERHKRRPEDHKGPGWHLNLYARNDNGHLHLMTADHIIPRSRKGKSEIDNLQPMCTKCNQRKGDKVPPELEHLVLRKRKSTNKPGRKLPSLIGFLRTWGKIDKRGRVHVIDWERILRWQWIKKAIPYAMKVHWWPGIPMKWIYK